LRESAGSKYEETHGYRTRNIANHGSPLLMRQAVRKGVRQEKRQRLRRVLLMCLEKQSFGCSAKRRSVGTSAIPSVH
jgi:hypothetical protein